LRSIKNANFAVAALRSWDLNGNSNYTVSVVEKVRAHMMCTFLFLANAMSILLVTG